MEIPHDPPSDRPPEAPSWLRRVPLLACLVVLVIGYFYSSTLDHAQRFKDERDYHRLGYYLYEVGVFSTDGVTPTAYRAPGYPVVVGAISALLRSAFAARMLNYTALCATLLLGSRFLARRGMPRAAALSAVLVATYPPFSYTASTIYPQTLGGLLLAMFFVLLPRERGLGLGRALALGLTAAALVLTIPTFLAAIAAGLLWLLLRDRKAALGGVLVVTACVGLSVLGWGLRNQAALGSFVPLTTNAGRNLLLGNSPGTTATSGVNVDLSGYEEAAEGLDEVERDRYYRQAALEWIRENPAAAARLYVLKLLSHWNVWNTYATDEELGWSESIVLALFFVPLFAVFVWRLLRLRRTPLFPGEGALLLAYFTMAFASAVFFTRIRFRLPLDHAMIWIVAAFVAGDRRRSPAPAPEREAREPARLAQ